MIMNHHSAYSLNHIMPGELSASLCYTLDDRENRPPSRSWVSGGGDSEEAVEVATRLAGPGPLSDHHT